MRACLSFAELLGLLTFTGAFLTYAELSDDDHAVRESLQFAVLDTDLLTMEDYARRAMAVYQGTPEPGDAEVADYVRCLAVAVTRVFGVAA
ncbi:hypothetical protein [Streptomyces sp. NPDC056672]|uniref:hypothetical protein n=1 Tax=Streptomyces sp. NPDC056672 TaxID=3345906 RepID=UPI0036AD8612